jgi:hypothetical protein
LARAVGKLLRFRFTIDYSSAEKILGTYLDAVSERVPSQKSRELSIVTSGLSG